MSAEARAGAIGAAAVIFFCGGATAARAATSITPSLNAIAAWTDNIDLSPPGEAKSGEFYSAEPGLAFTHDSALEHASLTYTLHALFFSGGQHDFLHSGTLASTTRVIPDWFELNLAGQRFQGSANPAEPANLEYLFPVASIGNFTSGFVKPDVKHAFRSFQFEASYTRGISEDELAGGSPAGNAGSFSYRSNIQEGLFTVGSVEKAEHVTWNAGYQLEQDEYEDPYNLRFLYEQVHGEVGIPTISTLRLIARGGKESNPENGISQGGLASPFWAAGFDWSTGPRDNLQVLVGHRYFGHSFEGHWRREMRLLKLQVDYTEQPTTLDATVLQQPLAIPAVAQVPGTYTYSRLAPTVFLGKNLGGTATLAGRLTEIGFSIISSEQIYYATATPGGTAAAATPYYDDHLRSATLHVTRRLGPQTTFDISGTYGKYDVVETTQGQYTYQNYYIRLTRIIGRHSSLYIRVDHTRQYGQTTIYDMNAASLGFNVALGNPPAQTAGIGVGNGLR